MASSIRGIQEAKDFFKGTRQEIDRATKNAARSTATAMRSKLIKRISSETGLNKKLVSDSIRVQQSRSDLNAQIYASTNRISLEKYSPSIVYRGTRGTVHADVSLLRTNQVLTKGFFANPASGKIWKRKGKNAYPISKATGPSVYHHTTRVDNLIDDANETLVKLFWDRLAKQIAKRK